MISIIIPTYNHAPELRLCLASIKNQSYQDFEIVVVDDGSIDNPESVARQYSNLQFVRQPNLGAPVARNKGFELARGEFVIFVDADVVLDRFCLEKMHKKLIENSGCSFVYSAFKIGSKKMKYIEYNKKELSKYNFIHTTSLIRREDFSRFDINLKRFQDWDLWLTMMKDGKIGIGINECLFKVIHPGQGTISTWLPKFIYKFPWPIMNYIPLAVKKYYYSRDIIRKKHSLM